MSTPSDIAAAISGITDVEAAHVLWHFGCGGYPPGSFVEQLLATIAHADPTNKGLLARGFPGYVAAVWLAAEAPGGVEVLRGLAGP